MSPLKFRKLMLAESSALVTHVLSLIQKRKGTRSWSIHPINVAREKDGEFKRLYFKLRKHPKKFRQYFRMSISTFDSILKLVGPQMQPQWTNFVRNPVCTEERLTLTIRFLATGRSFRDLALTFKLGVTTVIKIVNSTVILLWKCLQSIHMRSPSSEDFLKIADDFYNIWNFPNTIGAIDGKHIRLKCPPKSGTMFYNYKHYFSIVLQAIVDAHGKFIVMEVGGYGKQSDGGTFRSSKVFQLMQERKLNIPADSALPHTSTPMPFVFIGDEAYPLLRHLLKPYKRRDINPETEYFNYRLSRARRIVECAFGIMSAKWRLLWKPIETSPKFADNIVKCICVLHNTIIDLEGNIKNDNVLNQQQTIQNDSLGRSGNRPSNEAINIRESFKNFLLQNQM